MFYIEGPFWIALGFVLLGFSLHDLTVCFCHSNLALSLVFCAIVSILFLLHVIPFVKLIFRVIGLLGFY